ncbi:CDP-diacylglycerol--glycerol-3-phosphate 3-phosphatidyltransferase [Clostridium argentinense CDC 2741]|uniref:CDP-diacylglycerol--glycerol-3-phosphate 3-phosphatidyltransferase n=1 Tax=Clostridium argentinense CDC 2741 TaxID=1418104 RepID=A0A0C1U648_9CLOT|nr:CDP-diacylglycerol--glycerol-3-phosphate 3-phosphatidyltransferase [Clostridium argentinense]ARC85593.1 CDP-diacylglycerol--glycerol-3-phosphate 3-phosphatidyltransferase [Clostridium argentinense]KIE47243.1 CDP-diacylglycerol--glycerol-3-phosphate 3-phosphatidyltransferase [Clostridium argentinense CDC 2741]NFF40108.1 CDP-diacylglycerol--glycerol-3-phosphate 3-phosphatidyltransferase [Clostridium argentinense]NFP52499.1 CDP-diacylglycerol--glycerol-3-phosphate 3-phosphatidyltransferase [Clo
MNLANKLTVIRILLVPIFLVFIALNTSSGTILATIVFVVASLTDKLDGYIARSRNQVTTFGKFMDPLADKLLVTSALVSLVELQVIPGWVAMIIIAREFAVSGLRTLAASEGIVIAASNWGKAKTVIQIVAIIAGLVTLSYNSWIIKIITIISMTLAVIITIISGLDYFYKNVDVIKMDK